MAAKNKLSVDTAAISNTVTNIRNQLLTIREARTYVTSQALPALEQVWSGPAKDAYAAELALYVDNLDEFIKVGDALNQALSQAGRNYEAAEQNALNKIAALPK